MMMCKLDLNCAVELEVEATRREFVCLFACLCVCFLLFACLFDLNCAVELEVEAN